MGHFRLEDLIAGWTSSLKVPEREADLGRGGQEDRKTLVRGGVSFGERTDEMY